MGARPTGLEPATPGSTVRYSNQLSYGPPIEERILWHPQRGSKPIPLGIFRSACLAKAGQKTASRSFRKTWSRSISQVRGLLCCLRSSENDVCSPDDRWLVAVTQTFPDNLPTDLTALNVAQTRIQLIEAATGEVRETIVALQEIPTPAVFSPNGRTFATTGSAKVDRSRVSTSGANGPSSVHDMLSRCLAPR